MPAPVVATTEKSVGTPAKAGPVVSTTLTVNEPLAVLRAASVAEQVTTVSPSGRVAPDTVLHETATAPSTRSDAVGAVKFSGAPAGPVASTVMSPTRPDSCGAVVS